ncbi:MAG: HRDC domain-containing protein [Chloroflexi bacterium]|nr:HRDC domain-containing protein [Chloroflexota bacterium]
MYRDRTEKTLTDDPSTLRRPLYIRRTAELRHMVEKLADEPLLAIDTESNSLYAYYERVCLVQLSSRTEDYLIDPLTVEDMSPLGRLLADPQIEIVFHAAEYDIMSLKRDFQFSFNNIFDTMLAARACGWAKTGLGSLVEEQFGRVVDKRMQRADWSRRPLPPEQLQYAQYDTHFLPILRDRLLAELETMGRLDSARETFAALSDLPAAQHRFDPDGFWRIHQVRDLRRFQIAIVRELYLLRDEMARQRDWPPFKVMTDETMVQLASLGPRRADDLRGIKGLNDRLVERDGEAIIQAIVRGSRAKLPLPPTRDQIDPDIQARYEALKDWRKQRAAERGVESDVILPRDVLWTLARQLPTRLEDLDNIPGLGPWRRAEYGAELLHVLEHANDQEPGS